MANTLTGFIARIFGRDNVAVAPAPVVVLGSYDSGSGSPVPTPLAVSEAGGFMLAGTSYTASATNTRPSDVTAYAALDVVGDTGGSGIIEFANIGPAGGLIFITDSYLQILVSSVPSGMGNQRLHLFSTDQLGSSFVDNSAFNLVAADRPYHLGWIDMGIPVDIGDTIAIKTPGHASGFRLADGSTTLWGVRQTMTAYTPTSAAQSRITLHSLSA